MAFVSVARVDAIAPGKGVQISVAGRKIAVFRSATGVYAIDALCPHRSLPLAQGECDGETVTCPWHVARFDLTTGRVLCGPARSDVSTYPAEIRGAKVFVDVPGAKQTWWQRLFGAQV